MIIDAHLHIWDLGRFRYSWITPQSGILNRTYLPAEIEPQLRACGVGGAVFVQANDSPAESEWVLGLTRDHPWLLGVVGWVDLADPRAGDVLDALMRHPRFAGVRSSSGSREWLLDAAIQPGLRALAERNLSFDILAGHEQLARVPELLRRHPDLQFVLDHLGGPPIASSDLAQWRRDLAAVAAFPNIAAKVSGLLTLARRGDGVRADMRPAVRAALDHFGPRRLMFGGDWPVSLLAAPYASTLDAVRDALRDLPAGDAEHVWSKTAQRVYRLEPPVLSGQGDHP